MIGYLKIGLLFVAITAVCLAAWLGWQNRGSERVILTLLPAAAVGAIGALATLLFTLRADGFTEEFIFVLPAVVSSRQPIPETLFHLPGDCPSRLVEASTVAIESTPEVVASEHFPDRLYADVLFREFLECLFSSFSQHWEVVFLRSTHPAVPISGSRKRSDAGGKINLTWDAVKTRMPNTPIFELFPILDHLALPPGSVLSIGEVSNGHKLTIANEFAEIRVSVTTYGGLAGLGVFAPLTNRPDKIGEVWRSFVHFEVSAEFKALRIGHPKAGRYREWAGQILDIARLNFDTASRWERARDLGLLALR